MHKDKWMQLTSVKSWEGTTAQCSSCHVCGPLADVSVSHLGYPAFPAETSQMEESSSGDLNSLLGRENLAPKKLARILGDLDTLHFYKVYLIFL